MSRLPEESSSSISSETQPQARITIEEQMTPWKMRGEKPEWKSYDIDIHTDSGVMNFANLFTDKNGASFIWPGTIDFSQLETTALGEISSRLTQGKEKLTLDDESTRKATQAILIMRDDTPTTPLREFTLGNPRQLAAYREILTHSDNVSFANYHVEKPTFSYVFTGDNPVGIQAEELAVRIPYSQNWTEEIVSFALQTHKNPSALEITPEEIKTITDTLSVTMREVKLAIDALQI